MSGSRILVIEDDSSISLGLKMNLQAEGYQVSLAEDGVVGLERARNGWDLIILDVMLPRMNGFEVLRTLQAEKNKTPILLLTARNLEMDKVTGLELGAEDYVTKPFGLAELLARIRVILRRADGNGNSERWVFGDIELDRSTREARRDGTLVPLTATEFDVLTTLVGAQGRVLSRQQILDGVRGEAHFGTLRTVDNFVAQLRSKLESDPQNPRHLVTVRGVGYRFVR